VIVDHVDKVHGISIEAKVADPFFEAVMLIFHLFDKTGEEVLHILLHHEHLRDLCVGILADDVLQLTPLHLFAFVVEERAFAFCVEALLADEGRLSALGVDADHEALVSVDALWAAS
jgi:hypothetical protein